LARFIVRDREGAKAMTSHRGSHLVSGPALLLLVVGCQSVETSPDDPRQWGEPELIETRTADAFRPQIAIDAMGTALAVWDQTDQSISSGSGSDDIWSNRLDASSQWGAAVRLEENEPGDSFGAQIGVGGDGSAMVVFLQVLEDEGEATPVGVWAVRHTLSDGWGATPERIESNVAGDAGQVQVAVGARGGAVAVWTQFDADEERLSIWSNRFTAGDGWGDAGPVQEDVDDLVVPQVAMDADGNAIVVWEGFDGEISSIWSRRLTSRGDHEALQPVENDSGNAFFPQVAADADGNAIAVWQQQTDGERFDVWFNRYLASTGSWGLAERIEQNDAGDAEKPQVAIDGNADAIAVWVQSGGGHPGIWSNRYTANVGWGDAAPIGPSSLVSARSPQIATDPEGDAAAVWVQFDGVQDSVWSNRYSSSGGWGVSQPIEFDDNFRVQGPQVAMDFEGNAVAVWSQQNADFEFDVWSTRLE
jgi:hypothetical protein